MMAICEQAAAALDAPDFATLHRDRLSRLQRDMLHVGAAASAAPEPPPEIADTAQQVGAFYTVFGSTRGAAVLHRALGQLLTTDAGREFFATPPIEIAAWREFCARLEAFGRAGNRLPQLIAGANTAFAHFSACAGPAR